VTGRAGCRFTALLLVVCIQGYAVAGTADDPVAGLSRCAATADRDERLACYDGLASRYAQPNRKTTAAAPTAASSSSQPAHTAAVAATAAATSAKVPSAEPKSEFGLSVSQLRKEPDAPVKPQSIDGVVTGFGTSSLGRPVVRLDNTQSWELLDELDPLLSPGDKVTIRRAAMGSFLLTTPTKRMHRVRRIS
jgi:hypothetical protein